MSFSVYSGEVTSFSSSALDHNPWQLFNWHKFQYSLIRRKRFAERSLTGGTIVVLPANRIRVPGRDRYDLHPYQLIALFPTLRPSSQISW